MSHLRHSEPLPLGTSEHPYSKGLMARALVAVGVPLGRAYELAKRIDQDLVERAEQSVELERVEELAIEVLGEDEGSEALRRLRRFRELQELDLPVIVLVGGATGTGKSTVATEAAYRLGITRVTSTDFVRQTMRAFFSKEFMPSIHYSSFEAAAGLREPEQADDPVIAGFLEQTRNVMVGVRASIERALEEGWSMVLEGVHLVPGMLPRVDGALVVQCVLAIEDEEEHSTHFMVRDAGLDGLRPHLKYLDRLDDIRRIQEYIVRRAKRHNVPVIVLVGGATGTGKSTVATEAAYRLGITRVTSTDFVRQTMRAFFSKEFMPSIHYSSFEAAAGLREPEQADDPVIAGFLEQTRNVMVGVRASIERALEEGWSMVLEGVHLVPGMLPRVDGALVVQCVLAIEDEEEHSTHFMVRDAGLDGLRPHLKYIERLDDIRRIQDHIVRRAKRHNVPVIANTDIRAQIDAVLELVLASAEQVQRV